MQFASAISRGARDYLSHVRNFSPNARYFLIASLFNGLVYSVYSLLFNFYLVSLGYQQDFLGLSASLNQLVVLLASLPGGMLGNRIGRRNTLLIGMAGNMLSFVGMVLFTSQAGLLLSSSLYGATFAILIVMGSPFLMDNSRPAERQHLFSIYAAISAAAGMLGGFIGGNFPSLAAGFLGVGAQAPQAYQSALLAVIALQMVGVLPLLRVRTVAGGEKRVMASPLSGIRQERRLLLRLFLPVFVLSIGAGLLMPFAGVFIRSQYNASDAQVGLVFSLTAVVCSTAIAFGPLTAARFGKIRAVIIEEALSVPMLLLAGFSPWFELGVFGWLMRMAFMQMNGPIFNTYLMEVLQPETRTTAASLNHMIWTFGSVVCPVFAGLIQVRYGWSPLVLGMAALYVTGIALNYSFFWKSGAEPAA
ncbi:MAG: MFS transporter [Chloroflexi bacterium]|nr:MFS transporter [Chloroflexota bacterium]